VYYLHFVTRGLLLFGIIVLLVDFLNLHTIAYAISDSTDQSFQLSNHTEGPEFSDDGDSNGNMLWLEEEKTEENETFRKKLKPTYTLFISSRPDPFLHQDTCFFVAFRSNQWKHFYENTSLFVLFKAWRYHS
jgi:hypothetical protein